jgi:methylenetetrahydrofolate dehydrogenase (NADP+)/methenyltetrahydrofolate cyclohydrolase
VHGILVQLPLPRHLNSDLVINAIDPAKDVDGFHISNVGLLGTGQKAMVPCTPLGCLLLLRDLHGSLAGMDAVVIGRSNIVGKPMAQLLWATAPRSRSPTAGPGTCRRSVRRADIVVAAVGGPGWCPGDWIKPGATVIDVGINRVEARAGRNRIVGDVDYDRAAQVAGARHAVRAGWGR